jgi:hypothetical protein
MGEGEQFAIDIAVDGFTVVQGQGIGEGNGFTFGDRHFFLIGENFSSDQAPAADWCDMAAGRDSLRQAINRLTHNCKAAL